MGKYHIDISEGCFSGAENYMVVKVRLTNRLNPQQHREVMDAIEKLSEIVRPQIDIMKPLEQIEFEGGGFVDGDLHHKKGAK